MLIYDKKENTLERFEPHGGPISEKVFDGKKLNIFLTWFATQLHPDCTYIPPTTICPYIGPQTVEENTRKELGLEMDLDSCTVWSFLYVLLRLKIPDISASKVILMMLNGLHKRDKHIWDYILVVMRVIYDLSEKIRIGSSLEELQQFVNETKFWGPNRSTVISDI